MSAMCGLLAYFSASGTAEDQRDAIAQALESLHHRGPDETGVEVIKAPDGPGTDAVFGHKRLSIIDVASSHEPLPYADGRYLLTFNGEIYNYLELREELAREHGARFATAGDGEVIAAAYHVWGPDALHRLRGMFAFVIWDRKYRTAFGARDRYGIKPLHYLQTPDGVYLASEKKALLAFAPSARQGDAGIDYENLSHYLTLQYVPEPRTLHRGIARIGSGECLTWTPESGIEVRRWYRPVFQPPPTRPPRGGWAPPSPPAEAR
jgi:asparagine synthase (glutamine-hydrolysing)